MKHFLDLATCDETRVARLLELARACQAEPRSARLAGRVLALIFLNPSLRTLASFQTAMAHLGGASVVLTPGQSSWALEIEPGVRMDGAKAEHVREAVPVLEQYADAIGIRSFGGGVDLADDLRDPVLSAFAELARKPLINLESARSHPCQALADRKTLDDEDVPSDARFVLSWASHPRPLPLAVPASTLTMAAQRGMDVCVLRPEGFALPGEIMSVARAAAARSGGRVTETDRRDEALDGAHVLYAKSWQAPSVYGRAEAEAALRRAAGDWTVTEAWFRGTADGARFMHCLPVRRNVVVADEVLDGPRSRVVAQAGNRLHVQKAVLLDLLETDS